MPYIRQEERESLDIPLEKVADQIKSIGQLNYVVTNLVLNYLWGPDGNPPTYADYNAAIGVLECAKLELYRRRVSAYEEIKIAENGDVTPRW